MLPQWYFWLSFRLSVSYPTSNHPNLTSFSILGTQVHCKCSCWWAQCTVLIECSHRCNVMLNKKEQGMFFVPSQAMDSHAGIQIAMIPWSFKYEWWFLLHTNEGLWIGMKGWMQSSTLCRHGVNYMFTIVFTIITYNQDMGKCRKLTLLV